VSPRAVIVAALLIAALCVRVIEVQATSYVPRNDPESYLTLASQIAGTGDYAASDGAGGSQGPTAYFAPGYPYLLAAVDLADQSTGAARLSQAVLGTVTVALIGLLALELFGPTTALVALAIAAAYPVLIETSGTLIAENLSTPLVLAAVYGALRSRRSADRRYAWAAAAGILTGLATLTHENALILVIPLALALRQHRRALVLLIAATVLTIAPWTLRNAIELHRFIPVSDESGLTLAGTYNPTSAADKRVPYRWQIYFGIPSDRSLVREAHTLTEPQLSDKLLSRALAYIGHHPLSPLAVGFHNTMRLLELDGKFAWRASSYAIGIPTRIAAIGVVSFWLLCLFAIPGAFTHTIRRSPRWVWAVPLLLALTVILVNAETPRFREPIDPFLVLAAACALHAAAEQVLGRSPITRHRQATAARDAELVEVGERLP
jgi:4-amino-4-deoxy-L-arabinose transferase-like glycosyltransferase